MTTQEIRTFTPEEQQRWDSWWATSFTLNMKPILDAATDAECKRLNEVITHTNRELAQLHKQVAVLTEIVRRSVTADRFQKRLHEVSTELDIVVNYDALLYDGGDDDANLKAVSEAPSIFSVATTVKQPDDIEPKERTWLQRMFNR